MEDTRPNERDKRRYPASIAGPACAIAEANRIAPVRTEAEIKHRERCARVWDRLPAVERRMRELMATIGGCRCALDCCERPIHVSVARGAYGAAGVVVAVQGSPPHGLLWVGIDGSAVARLVSLPVSSGGRRPRLLAPGRYGTERPRHREMLATVRAYLEHVGALASEATA